MVERASGPRHQRDRTRYLYCDGLQRGGLYRHSRFYGQQRYTAFGGHYWPDIALQRDGGHFGGYSGAKRLSLVEQPHDGQHHGQQRRNLYGDGHCRQWLYRYGLIYANKLARAVSRHPSAPLRLRREPRVDGNRHFFRLQLERWTK